MPAKKTKKTRQQEFDAAIDRAMAEDDARDAGRGLKLPAGMTHEERGQAVLDDVQARIEYVGVDPAKGLAHEVHHLANILDQRLKEIRDAFLGAAKAPAPTYPPPPPGGFHPASVDTPEPESFDPPDAEVVTLEDIHRAFVDCMKRRGEKEVKAILKKFGVDRASQTEPAKLPALLKAFEA